MLSPLAIPAPALAACVGLVLLALANRANAQPTCLTSVIACAGSSHTTSAPADSMFCAPSPGVRPAYAAFDLSTGRFAIQGVGAEGAASSSLQIRDDFFVHGLLAGTPVSLTAELIVNGWAGGGCGQNLSSGLSALLQQPSMDPVFATVNPAWECPIPVPPPYCCGETAPLDTTLSLGIQTAAGANFRLTVVLSGSASGTDFHGTAYLRFIGLPPGAGVSSCKGYAVTPPTLALRTSWGRVKAIYR